MAETAAGKGDGVVDRTTVPTYWVMATATVHLSAWHSHSRNE